ncbi:tRNA pseudouridine synthase 3 [Gryganskiella cystojenkinii]|nr:tRNA pseudouridine synthase 3 [Gryganskiella cystojenkinii]
MLLSIFRRIPHARPHFQSSSTTTSVFATNLLFVESLSPLNRAPFSTSSVTAASRCIVPKKRPVRDNTPFLKNATSNNIKNFVEDYNPSSMPTNKDRPPLIPGRITKAERKRRNREGGSSAVIGSGSGTVDKYSTWPRDALLQRIRELEATNPTAAAATAISTSTTGSAIPAHLMSASTSSSPVSLESTPRMDDNTSDASVSRPETPSADSAGWSPIETPKRKDRRPFDFSKYAKRHVAFKVAYFGWPYGGFASQGVNEVKTVESELFNALMAARIIEDPLQCNYSRCGRTDRGVSGLGQVIALTVRSGLPKSSRHVIRSEGDGFVPETEESKAENANLTQEELEAKEGVYWKRGIKRNKDGSVFGELAYLNIINRLLPPDIRIVAWAPVKEDFNARFHCSWRQYKYFFPKGIIDIDRMRTAAVKFLGTHDFRNFCKYDASKTIENYDRTIHAISIEPVPEHEFSAKPSREFYQLTLRGSAFLWHQVRCMMSVLFAVGQGLEEPEIVDQLMDLEQCPAKPNYDMASDLPLVLHDCHFENLEWQYQTEVDLVNDITPLRLYRAMEDQWSCYVTKSLMYSRMLEQLDQAMLINLPEKGQNITLGDYATQNAKNESNISLGGDLRMFMGKRYSSLMERQKCLPTEVKAKKHAERKRQKLALAESAANSENNSADNSEVDSPKPSQTAHFTSEPSGLSHSSSTATPDVEGTKSAPVTEKTATTEASASLTSTLTTPASSSSTDKA